MKKVLRLNESDLIKIVRKIIKEAPEMPGTSMGATAGPKTNIPECASVMKGDGNPGSSIFATGPFDKISANFSVAPPYQGYTLFKQGKPFCFIPKR